ncbi:hypothetical protein KO494_00995 [Lacinutrix sp. C3R15]|uniref:hypothetical protein n=1 Tax=Flavobacteriaceae TaxID=49546 RepID=UPI001C08C25F|nr:MULTISPECIES: hypothetical protein [Flavobacteriaceae]MBU2938103.1 hypothetical protein [Lacinutrix sp. C3R15]MDO6621417.1 hypothetical protein [Oceanihabitans sp. 1_MG-2023]
MSDKKHIDRIFQEKLKDLEETPNAKVWKNIQSKIEQPEEDTKKAFPIWLRVLSIAAVLLLLLTIGNLYNTNKNNTKTNTTVVDTENTVNTSEIETNTINQNASNTKIKDSKIVEESNNTTNDAEFLNKKTNASEEKKTYTNTSIANTTTTKPTSTKKQLNNANANTVVNNKTYTSTSKNKNTNKEVVKSTQQPAVGINNTDTNRVAAHTTQEQNQEEKTQNNTALSTTVSLEQTGNTNANAVAQNNSSNNTNNKTTVTELDKNKATSALKNSATNAITATTTEKENTATDATLAEEVKKEEVSIEEAIANAEELDNEEEETKNLKKWEMYANIAPVYYNTLGKGSHMDEQFVNNTKTGEINTSYGVNVSYAFNEKLKLRTGFNSLNLSYDTDDVIIYQNVSSNSSNNAPLKNITFNSEQPISAISATNLTVQEALGILPDENAAISQRLGYYEVPMELEYTISTKRFGVNVIAGLSTFFLNHNKIFSEFEGRKTEIGKANNVNNFSFSGNLGFGFDYKFSDKIIFNAQPTFKYQMNAFENTSGDFRPYIIGLYTGLSYKF